MRAPAAWCGMCAVHGGRQLPGMPPMIVKGKLIVGVLDQPDGYIQAYDAADRQISVDLARHSQDWASRNCKTWSDNRRRAAAPSG